MYQMFQPELFSNRFNLKAYLPELQVHAKYRIVCSKYKTFIQCPE